MYPFVKSEDFIFIGYINMKTLGNKLVNHSFQSFGQKLTRAAEIAGTIHSMYTAAKAIAPYVARFSALL